MGQLGTYSAKLSRLTASNSLSSVSGLPGFLFCRAYIVSSDQGKEEIADFGQDLAESLEHLFFM
jgi:hypothetical protein